MYMHLHIEYIYVFNVLMYTYGGCDRWLLQIDIYVFMWFTPMVGLTTGYDEIAIPCCTNGE